MTRCARWCLGLCVLVAALAVGRPATAATEQEIEAARLKGVEFLRSQQQTDGSWEFANYNTGCTALCTLALIENGVPLSDPVVDKGYKFVKKQASEVKNTYEVALSILLLARVGDRLDKPTIRMLGARLLAGQNKGGGWGYTCPQVDASVLSNLKKLDRQDGDGDNSCTQFGVLGLWVASRYGVPIDEAMSEVASRFLDGQNEDGGWSYKPSTMQKKEPTGPAMTCAGLFSLTVARATRIRAAQKEKSGTGGEQRGERATLLADPAYNKGFNKVGEFAKGISAGSPKYFMWSVERLGVLLGLEKINQADWFNLGADALLKTQRPDGSWAENKEALSDTSFAILFLRKANLGSDISRLLEGEPDKQFAITTKPDQPRYDTFEDALKAAGAGDIVRIDGNGPFRVGHVLLDKDITIQAGFGYTPVLEFAVGLDPKGLRYRPERDDDGRNMFKVTAGTATLEGLKLQMDPPITTGTVPWRAVLFKGGSLRMLNCSISEGNRRGMAGAVIAGEGEAYFRNCQFVGGRTCVEVLGVDAKQQVTLENCVLFGNACITVANDSETKKPADVALRLYNSCVQGVEAFAAPNLKGKVAIDSRQTLYKVDSLSLSLLPTSTGKDGRSWTGDHNVYNVTNWLGAGGKKSTVVADVKGFNKFWGGTDVEGSSKIIAWVTSRKNGGFSHSLNPQDWDLGDKSELAQALTRYGISAATVGPGDGFVRYREDFRYNEWKRGVSRPDVALSTP